MSRGSSSNRGDRGGGKRPAPVTPKGKGPVAKRVRHDSENTSPSHRTDDELADTEVEKTGQLADGGKKGVGSQHLPDAELCWWKESVSEDGIKKGAVV